MGPIPRHDRREFLTGEAARAAIEHLADRLAPAASGAESGADSGATRGAAASPCTLGAGYLLKYSRRAMACQFEVAVNAGQHPAAAEAALAALDLVDALEAQLSVYRDSEVAAINRHAGGGPVEVEPRLFDLLEFAKQLYCETEGAFDVTAGPLAKAWGFFQRQAAVPSAQALAEARASVGSQHLELHRERRSVRLARTGMELNLGSIGKGYALDRCAELLASEGLNDFLWHAGQSSVLARGDERGSRGWLVGVGDPMRPGRRMATIRLVDAALGTSGSGVQFFRHEGRRYGHILDPRSGEPVQGMISSTVVAPTAAAADALATALYVMGPAAARRYAAAHPLVAALLTWQDEASGRPRVETLGFAPGTLELLEPWGQV